MLHDPGILMDQSATNNSIDLILRGELLLESPFVIGFVQHFVASIKPKS